MEKIEILNYIKAPASTVYETLTTEKGLGEVWTNKLNVKAESGFVNEFDFNEETLTKMKILELNKTLILILIISLIIVSCKQKKAQLKNNY